ncbi:MAG TPA: hypothetical protein VJV79_04235 [Polyangiaceae bacterium]|nr:hypothetical protein [Polyangiaceae bacterium]
MHRALELLRSARFAPALPCVTAVARVRAESRLDLANARARAGFARGHLLDIVIYVPGGTGAAYESEAAEALVRLLLGEELFERWVGSVSATPTVRGGPLTVLNENSEQHSALPIATLPETVRAAIAGLRLGLPVLPPAPAEGSADWIAFELEPERAADYAAQDDLLLCSTRTPELKKSFLQGEPFYSGRFCNSEALFVYLKYDSSEPEPERRLAERTRLEALISRALAPAQATLVGLGLGLRYDYLDLAVADPSCIGEQLLPALRGASVPPRAWLLFCDSELEREYIPVHADTPEPYWG